MVGGCLGKGFPGKVLVAWKVERFCLFEELSCGLSHGGQASWPSDPRVETSSGICST